MTMKVLFSKRKVTVVSVLLVTAFIFAIIGLMLEETVPGTWGLLCEIEGLPHPDDIIQIGDTMYLANEGETIRVFRSYDGCNWLEVESPSSDHNIWTCSIALFKASDDILGIAWEEMGPDRDKEPRSTFFWSTFDGNTWSGPEILFSRDVYCFLNDTIMLKDGALLLMWEEPLIQYIKNGERTIEYTGCRVVYRAYVGNDELLIERVIEPEDPFSCEIEGDFFVDAGNIIWCLFEYWGDGKSTFYKTKTEDGRQWTPPEQFLTPKSNVSQVLVNPQGEIRIFDYYFKEGNLFLLTCTDWANWSKEKIFKTEKDVVGGFHLTEGRNGTMWGLIVARDSTLFIQPSQESGQEYHETMLVVNILNCLAIACIVLIVVLTLSWMWKRS